jgi:hypothetical protein
MTGSPVAEASGRRAQALDIQAAAAVRQGIAKTSPAS